MTQPIIAVEHVTFRYADQPNNAVENLSFQVERGQWLAIVGHNGSGKSTLSKLLTGLLFPSEGTIHIAGLQLTEQSLWDVRRRIGLVFQNPDNQFVGITVRDDVAFALENQGLQRDEMIERIDTALRAVRMSDFVEREPHHLSGGQKQRVAIAGVLALQPDIIILDEATSMLDPKGRLEIIELVQQLRKEKNITVLSITHDLEEVRHADNIIVLNKGRLFAAGAPREIFAYDEKLVEIGLDVPFAYRLSRELQAQGIELREKHLSMEGVVDELCSLKRNS